jgi:hypothetical protein
LRQDINGTSYALKEIVVYNQPNNNLIKKFKLSHSYFNDVSQASKIKLDVLDVWGYKLNTVSGITSLDSLKSTYSFEYKNASANFPKQTKGVDRWGYYNGVNNNIMLFDNTAPVQKPLIQQPADRSIHIESIDNGILTKMNYPTGGYTSFEYENNTIENPTIPFILINQNSSTTTPYIGGSTNIFDSSVKVASFSINATQDIKFKYGRTLDGIYYDANGNVLGNINRHRIFKLYKSNYIDDNTPTPPPTTIFISNTLGKPQLDDSVTLSLVPGSYYYYVTCDQQSLTAYTWFNYYTQSTQPYLGDPGAGVRIKTLSSFDNINATTTPAIIKRYEYGAGGRANPQYIWGVNSIVHHQFCEYTETVCTSDQNNSLSNLLANQFYYPTVTEINNTITGNGKTIYKYDAGTNFDAFGVNLILQQDYTNTGSLLREIKHTYTEKNFGQFSGMEVKMTDIVDNDNCINSPTVFLPTLTGPGGFDTIGRRKLYQATAYTLNSKYQYLAKSVESIYGENIATPLLVTTDYSYDNLAVFKPTKTVTTKSTGEVVTTLFKYPLDYAFNACNNWNIIDNNYFVARNNLMNTYQNCTFSRYNAAAPYSANPPYAPTQVLLNVLRAWPCEKNYMYDYIPIKNAMLSSINNLRTCYDPTFQSSANAGIIVLQKNYIETPIEQMMFINKNGVDYLQAATKTDFNAVLINNSYGATPKTIYQTAFSPTPVLKSDFLANPTNYYKPRVDFKYNSKGNLTEQSKLNDTKETYIWDYNEQNATAKIINADSINVAATSFESNGTGKFNFTGTSTIDANSITGSKTYILNTGNITKTNLDVAKNYIVSYWSDNGAKIVSGATLSSTGRSLNGFTYYEHKLINPVGGTITISGTGKIDELRLYPDAAQAMTYTYEPLVGITSQCDANNKITYYEYDALNRLILMKDQDNNILKKICYNYAGQVEDCAITTNTTAQWRATGNTRCQPCAVNPNYNSGVREKEEKDINPNSPTYTSAPRWVIDPTGTCPTPADYQPNGGTCQQVNGVNTGNAITTTIDVNPCSTTFGLPGTPIITASPLCVPCPVCNEPQYHCINGVCVQGTWKVIKVVRISKNSWECTRAWCYASTSSMDQASYSTYQVVTTGATPCSVECF